MLGRSRTRRARRETAPEADVDRRAALRLGGMAAAGAVGAVIVTAVNASPAAATSGAMMYGGTNDSGSAFTSLSSSNSGETLVINNSSFGTALVADAQTGSAALLRQLDTASTFAAVTIEKHGTVGDAVVVEASGNGAGVRVYSAGAAPNGAVDASQDNTGPVFNGTSASTGNTQPVYSGTHYGLGSGLRVGLMNTTNPAAVIDAQTAGTGRGMKIALTNRSNASAALSATTVGTGRALYGEINNPASATPAIEADTNGTGPALYGATTGHGEAILGDGRANGRGAVLGSNVAQLKLQPGSLASHPTSGQAGDLYVDKTARLWFCKGTTTWKQLA